MNASFRSLRTTLLFLTLVLPVSAQSANPHFRAAETALKAGAYRTALIAYQAGLRETPDDSVALYNAARSAAQTGDADTAFALLDRAFPAGEEWMIESTALTRAPDLQPLRSDPRWPSLLATVEKRNADVQAGPYVAPKKLLLAIRESHLARRKKRTEVEQQHGRKSAEMQALEKEIAAANAAELRQVEAILAQHGWLGPKQIGPRANAAIFLVIQSSEIRVQKKYLPVMRQAVVAGRAFPASFAQLEDGIAAREGRPQIYGSLISFDSATGTYFVFPLNDPDHVDERRAAVGLPPLGEYLKTRNLTWDVEAYKKQLPELKPYLKAMEAL